MWTFIIGVLIGIIAAGCVIIFAIGKAFDELGMGDIFESIKNRLL